MDDDLEYNKIDKLSVFEPHFFESLFIKVRTSNNKFTIIGNIYRPNKGHHANLRTFSDKLAEICTLIENYPKLSRCEDVQLLGDFNIDLLQYKSHSQTGLYVNTLLGHGYLPLREWSQIFGDSFFHW